MINNYGTLLSPEEIKKSKDISVYSPAAIYRYRKAFEKPTLQEGFHKVEKIKFTRKKDKNIYTNEMLGMDIDYLFCPHQAYPQVCYCRNPMPGMGVQFIEKYKLNPSQCIMVGDMKTDQTFAERCGFQKILKSIRKNLKIVKFKKLPNYLIYGENLN